MGGMRSSGARPRAFRAQWNIDGLCNSRRWFALVHRDALCVAANCIEYDCVLRIPGGVCAVSVHHTHCARSTICSTDWGTIAAWFQFASQFTEWRWRIVHRLSLAVLVSVRRILLHGHCALVDRRWLASAFKPTTAIAEALVCGVAAVSYGEGGQGGEYAWLTSLLKREQTSVTMYPSHLYS